MSHYHVFKDPRREERGTEISKVCKLCPKGEVSMPTLNRKLNWLVCSSENIQGWGRNRQKKLGTKKADIALHENFLNLRDWSSIRRLNGPIRLKEKRSVKLEISKWATESFKIIGQHIAKKFINYEESVAKKQVDQTIENIWALCAAERESFCCESALNSDAGLAEQGALFERRKSSRSWNSEQLWMIPRPQPTLEYSESKRYT